METPTLPHLLLATDRPAIREYFTGLRHNALWPFELDHIAASLEALRGHEEHLDREIVAVVDLLHGSLTAVELCQHLHHQRPQLPIGVLLCCANAVTQQQFNALAASGISGLVDLLATPDTLIDVIYQIALGNIVVQLHTAENHSITLMDLVVAGESKDPTIPMFDLSPRDQQLVEMVARGLSDGEIGQLLHLSPHTVKHRIERIRDSLSLSNRIELAAWAGQQGFYCPPASDATYPLRATHATAPLRR